MELGDVYNAFFNQINVILFIFTSLQFFLLNKSFPTTDDKYFSVGKCFRVDKVSTFINNQSTMVNFSS